jgi:glutamine cyclotransferase
MNPSRHTKCWVPALVIAGVAAWSSNLPARPVQAMTYKVVNAFPHDPDAYTQGLIFRDGVLYESTGRNGKSTIRKVDLKTGKVLQQEKVEEKYFAEGLTELNGKLFQLTWQHGVGFIYDKATMKFQSTFRYSGEGWGLTHDGKRLILSDGVTEFLRFFDPATFQETGRIAVRDQGAPVMNMNELEYVKGEVFANVWQTDRIARINPATGQVNGWINLAGLLPAADLRKTKALSPANSNDVVLNGIAYDPAGDRLFVTGKLWPKLFEIKLVPKP